MTASAVGIPVRRFPMAMIPMTGVSGAGVLAAEAPLASSPATWSLEVRSPGARRQRGLSACGCSPAGRARGHNWPPRCASGGIPDEVADSVLGRFAEVGLIDDAAFARAWVESRHHGRGLARKALAAELRQRGVADGEVRSAVGLLGPQDELATAQRLVAKRVAASRGKPMPGPGPPAHGHAGPEGLSGRARRPGGARGAGTGSGGRWQQHGPGLDQRRRQWRRLVMSRTRRV